MPHRSDSARNALVFLVVGVGVVLPSARAEVVERIGFTIDGLEPNGSVAVIDKASISPDGRFVCFASRASNLVVGDVNSSFDVFLLDSATGAIERQSVTSLGAEAPQGGIEGQAAPDGSRVLLRTRAKLVVQDNQGYADV